MCLLSPLVSTSKNYTESYAITSVAHYSQHNLFIAPLSRTLNWVVTSEDEKCLRKVITDEGKNHFHWLNNERQDLINDISDVEGNSHWFVSSEFLNPSDLRIEWETFFLHPPAHPHQSFAESTPKNWQNFRHDFEMCIMWFEWEKWYFSIDWCFFYYKVCNETNFRFLRDEKLLRRICTSISRCENAWKWRLDECRRKQRAVNRGEGSDDVFMMQFESRSNIVMTPLSRCLSLLPIINDGNCPDRTTDGNYISFSPIFTTAAVSDIGFIFAFCNFNSAKWNENDSEKIFTH